MTKTERSYAAAARALAGPPVKRAGNRNGSWAVTRNVAATSRRPRTRVTTRPADYAGWWDPTVTTAGYVGGQPAR